MLTTTAALVVVAGALAGGFVSGLAGFGTGLVALGFGCMSSTRLPPQPL